MKSRILAADIESYKEFMSKNLKANPNYIEQWINNNLLSSKKIGSDKILAFFAAEGEVLQELIQDGKTKDAAALLGLFNKFNNPILVRVELDLFTKVLEQIKDYLGEHSTDYKGFLGDVFSAFEDLSQSYHNDTMASKLQEASKLIGEICNEST